MTTIKGLISDCCASKVYADDKGIICCFKCKNDCVCMEVQRKKKKIKVAGRDLSDRN